ncbi:LuxR C-terminal-related transcriptional regulator [Amphritea sp. 2_MG-2023]|uniref:LuxR C-terminal-related transcriptional regulator n=1 Tax=Amphritea TaxID=515417 RepID=UPI001C06D705|nr:MULTISPECIES: LuxR C-terminal-related transcriptional regulator [Amphritea]MBU2964656.1 LuxR C-terminal-related transcriptional regulator [Amphritea atlantica]MDO6420402.1 LuxR C-terminal-related transcriptional regulator [Amphritea sp. 2_MG-2023]
MLARRQLLDQLDLNRDKRLILIAAPAGYGKSTLMSQWQHSLTQQGVTTAWLTLDEDDNDPGRLFTYLRYALTGNTHPVGSIDLRRSILNHATLLADFFKEPDAPSVLFIDELETLNNAESIRLLSMLQQQLPPGKLIVVASREKKTDWSLAKLKLQNELLELSDLDLRFSTQETTRLGELRLTGPFSDAITQALTDKTEGWIAGIRLAMLCFPRMDDAQTWVQNLTGEMDEITDFLSEELFRKLGTEQQIFLLKVSVLNRMNASLCEALTGEQGAQTQLESFCEKGLFLQPLDKQRHWFRLHGLVRQFLLKRLTQLIPQKIAALHDKAATWHDDQGYKLEAIHHAIAAKNLSFATEILESFSKYLVTQGQLGTLITLTAEISSQYPINTPTLLSSTCWASLFLHKQENAETLLQRLRIIKAEQGLPEELLSLFFTLESLLLIMKDDVPSAGTLAYEQLPFIREDDHFERGVLANIIALYNIGAQEYQLAQQYILKARAAHIKSGSCFGLAYSDTLAALREYQLGNLLLAKERFNQIGYDADYQNFDDPSLTKQVSKAVCLGFQVGLLFELNQFDEAQQLLDEHFADAINNTIPPDMVITGCLTRARIAFINGDLNTAYSYLEEGEIAGVSASLPRLVKEMRWERVRFAILLDDLDSAKTFAAQTDIDKVPNYPPGFLNPADIRGSQDIAPLRYDIHTGNTERALTQIRIFIADAIHTPCRALTLLVLQAIAHALREDAHNAHRSMIEALDLGLKIGSVRSIIDEGPQAIILLKALYIEWNKHPNIANNKRITYCDSLLVLVGESLAADVENTPLVENLSDRELEILKLVGGGLKNDQIANNLFLSVNTVKWHLRRLYEKLCVKSRTEALAESRKLGLID